jgi:hypothetical protein
MLGAELLAHAVAHASPMATADAHEGTRLPPSALREIAGLAYLVDLLNEANAFHQKAAMSGVGFVLNASTCDHISQPVDVMVALTNGRRPTSAARTLDARLAALLPVPAPLLMRRVAALPSLVEMDASRAPEFALHLVVKAVDVTQPLDVPRLHADILASGYLASERMPHSIRAAHALLYCIDGWGRDQDAAAANIHAMLSRGLPTTARGVAWGFDAISLCCVTPRDAAAGTGFLNARHRFPGTRQPLHYSHALREVAAHFRARFARG